LALVVFLTLDRNNFHFILQYPGETMKILPWLSGGFLALSFFYAPYSVLLLHKKSKTLLWVTLVSAGFNVGCNTLIIPSLGLLGAAASTGVSYTLLWLLAQVSAQKVEPQLRTSGAEVSVFLASIGLIFMVSSWIDATYW